MTYSFFELNANFQKKIYFKEGKAPKCIGDSQHIQNFIETFDQKSCAYSESSKFLFCMHPKCDFDVSKKKASHSPCLGPFQVQFVPDSTFVRQTVDRNRGSTTAPTTRRQ